MSNKPAAKTAGYFNTSKAASNSSEARERWQRGKAQKPPPPLLVLAPAAAAPASVPPPPPPPSAATPAPAPAAKAVEAAAVATFRVSSQSSEAGVKPAPVARTEYATFLSDFEIAELLQAFNKRCSIQDAAEIPWSREVVFTDAEEDFRVSSSEDQQQLEEAQRVQLFLAHQLQQQEELHRQHCAAARQLLSREPARATRVSSSKKTGSQKHRIERQPLSTRSAPLLNRFGKIFKRPYHGTDTQLSNKRSKKNKPSAIPQNTIIPLKHHAVTNLIRRHKQTKTNSIRVGPYYLLELPKDWKSSPYPNPRKRSYQDFEECQDQPSYQTQNFREQTEASTVLIKGPYKFRVKARFTAKWPKSLPARTRSQRKGTYICYIDLQSSRYGVTTMLTAKRLCVESLQSITTGIGHAQQAMFGRERNETRIDAQTTNRSDEPTVPKTNQDNEADMSPSDKKKETDSVQDFEWNDNPELNKPTKLSPTKSRDEMKEESKDDSDNELTERPSPKLKDESPVRTYEDVQNIGLAGLLLDDENERSPLRLELSKRRAKLRSQEQAERERKAQEEKERKILEERLRAERLGRIKPPEGLSLFQELSDELEQLVERAIYCLQPQKQLCLSFEGTPLRGQDFERLRPGIWLNDEIINAFIGLNVQDVKQDLGHKRRAIPMVEMFVSNFYSNLEIGQNTIGDPYSKVKRWASRKFIGGQDFLKCNLIITPVNLTDTHWTLLAFWPKHRVVEFYNSFRDSITSHRVLNLVKEYVKGELGTLYIDSEWSFRPGKSPVQHNGCDCGVFVCTTAKCLLLGYEPELSYTGANMAEQRKRIAAELLKGDLTGELKSTRVDGWLK